jgi:hypothetical protein
MDYKTSASLTLLMLTLSSAVIAQVVPTLVPEDTTDSAVTLPTLVVSGQETANLRPVTTYASPVSNLEFNPRIDFQSRNMAEAQGDVTIRGGIFENTGFRVGSATLIDPQTGHYSAELPIAPEMLTAPEVLVAGDNALYGFNSTVGTISYGWSQIQNGGSATIGGGDHDLNFQRLHHAVTGKFANTEDWSWGAEVETSRSESDGTIKHGDHDFDRTTGRVQLVGPNSQTDFFAGYQEKKFGWPAMYTATPSNHETESLKTRLFSINHQQNYGSDSHWEFSSYYRRNSDYYVLRRNDPSYYNATHETKSSAVALAGKHKINQAFAINHAAQFTTDSINSKAIFNGGPTGALEEGDFTSRSYIKISVLPEYRLQLEENEALTFRAGATFDDTNRDRSEVSPMAEITWNHRDTYGQSEKVYLSYAQATQLAGYGAIGGGESGRFASNYELDREISQNLELGGAIKRNEWSFEGAIFYRWDDGLVDWTYSESSSSSRQANAVDIETFGVELIASKRWNSIEAIVSYTFLDKDEDYGDDSIDASFYALNYAKHRITLGAIWSPCEAIQFRIDNEWRSQEDNDLRGSDNEALFTHIGVSVYPPQIDGLELFVAVDNAWDDDYEEVPGTPGRSDQVSCGATYRW